MTYKVLHGGEEIHFVDLDSAQEYVKQLVGEWSIVDVSGKTVWDWTDRVGP